MPEARKRTLRQGPHSSGFTAIELMITIAILGILAAVAAPSFTSLIEGWRVRSAAEDLQASLYFARSEALKRGGGVEIKATADGWNIVDTTSNDVLKTMKISAKTSVTGSDAVFSRWGTPTDPDNANAPMDIGFKFTSGSATREICMDQGGRVGLGACPEGT